MSDPISPRRGRDFIARHGETVFNAARRLQGDHPHTPLTRAGFAQADEMGRALRARLGVRPALTLWSSSAGRPLQTLAFLAEHLQRGWPHSPTAPSAAATGGGPRGGGDLADDA